MKKESADNFPNVTPEQWRSVAEASLRGRSLESLRKRTEDGWLLEVAYFPSAGNADPTFPGTGDYRRGSTLAPAAHGWDLRARIDYGGPATINKRALEELAGGANSLELVLPELDIKDAAQLNFALEEIYLDLAPVSLNPGAAFHEPIDWLCEVWSRREHDPTLIEGAWNIDPLATFARSCASGSGEVSRKGLEKDLQLAAELAKRSVADYGEVTALRADTGAYYDLGCTDAQELAFSLATSVEYLRAMERADLDLEAGLAQFVLGLNVDADLFAGIAKLRAARVLWARLAQACDVALYRGPRIQATTARRMFTRREPMNNTLRATTAAAAAVLGGADVVTTLPHDSRSDERSARGERLARNVQIILRQESHLSHVLDPGGGSWYLESRTEDLAKAAWELFRDIERAGGMTEGLDSGAIFEQIEVSARSRRETVRHRKRVLVGVNEFARLDSEDVSGDGVGQTSPLIPLDVDFERFRTASDCQLAREGKRPTVWLANLGSLAQHSARTSFCRGLLAAGGIQPKETESCETPRALAASIPEECRVAVLCSSDAGYAANGMEAVRAIKALSDGADAGGGDTAAHLYYAGAPKDNEAELLAAGVAGFLTLGMDAVALYERLYAHLGIEVPEGNSNSRGES